jgi:uncharacterized protein (DUF2249 family)
MANQTSHTVIDVRELSSCKDRHSTIFSTFEILAAREAFVIMVDHDPKPLRGKFEERYPGQFTWDYLEAGPEVWRVQISRI